MMPRAPFAALPLAHPPIAAKCIECRQMQREHPRTFGGQLRFFPARCSWCKEPTELVALVPVRVTLLNGDWCVAELDEPRIRRARASSPQITSARCLACDALHLGYEAECVGASSETHLPVGCFCKGPIEAVLLEPAAVSRGHTGSQLYVVVLEHDELECFEYGVDPCHDGGRS